jgi:pimeloyl-ACP methyl ester carboxylesterase
MTPIYIFSGLGADERVFQRLDFAGLSVTFVQWIIPKKDETIGAYAHRLLDQITVQKPILIGLSFGGIMAVEVAKLIDTAQIVLISSAKTKHEIPFYYRVAGKLGVHKLMPTRLMVRPTALTNWLFGATSPFDKQVLREVLANTNTQFLTWAIDQIARWPNTTMHTNLSHIHGTADRILPYQFVSSDLTIEGGGHLMILDKAAELSKAIRSLL